MTAVLPHAPAPANAVANAKSGTAVPTKALAPADSQAALPKSKFQALLDLLVPKPTTPVPFSMVDKVPIPKSKAPEHPVEKPKTEKKAATDETKPETAGSLLALLQVPVQVDPSIKLNKPADESALPADKTKNLKDDRRPSSQNGPLGSLNPGSIESRSGPPGQAVSGRTERSEEKQKVFVVDRRTETKEKEKLKLPGAEAAAQQPVGTSAEVLPKAKDPDAKADQVQVTFQSVAGKGQGSFDVQAQNTPVSPRDAASFQQYLVERGYGQMVDQARIVLKDQNAGEIRMTLYPESLGKVKVSLNLTDNSLDGRIFVENQTVKDIFQGNMDNLLQAFRDGGWNDLSLQVSVGGEQGPGNGNQSFQQAPQAKDYGRQVTQTVSVEGQANRIGSWNDRQINLTA